MYPIKLFIFCTLLTALSACSKHGKEDNPRTVLENYIKVAIRSTNEQDKKDLEEYFTGEALKKIKSMTDEEFLKRLVEPKYKFVRFEAKDLRQESTDKVSILYELIYDRKNKKDNARMTVRKIAYLIRNKAKMWKITNTRNIKTFVEVKKSLSVFYP